MEIDIDHELDTVVRRVEQTEQRAQRIGPVTGQAASGDGAITVEVRPGGLLSEVKLTPAALSSGSDALAAQIMALAERATRRAGANMHAALAPVLGPEGEKHLTSLGYEPDDEDDDEAFDTPLGHQQRRRVR
ncbi:YbaB/EbfC DNA-binding family protein [Actinokineospora alba]|uniref:YbaB/EbfC DNA-binding family protein n=1 Tax=Actinokineospora alba TaxID=504798 RepID=A0A1H0WGN6_9PSEU|nr:YbaB/EbfC family nucleoid-associated protein [Actinokineospora alba]TDP65332.1 YbaB/EbfC DNA-binding family protein [Actinokineospora alba]SDH59869.1 YbaB/EbfC DNA-binding family protein [Actinokineospora alba]SDP89892.1 YbaB/EbfC DNA-binding family protein [Actinokineospora alba]